MSETLHLRHQAHAGVITAEDLEDGNPVWANAPLDLSVLQAGFNSAGLCLHLEHIVQLGVEDVV
jgi:hypothetical protein